jgi:hypothetical protein
MRKFHDSHPGSTLQQNREMVCLYIHKVETDKSIFWNFRNRCCDKKNRFQLGANSIPQYTVAQYVIHEASDTRSGLHERSRTAHLTRQRLDDANSEEITVLRG